jgi:splicing suppressor protein 51
MEADLFVLFNPGLGSHALRKSWAPSLELLLDTRKPVLCSAHGPHDLKRDLSALTQIALANDTQELGDPLDFLIAPTSNPFASLKRAVDVNEVPAARIVRTNHSVYAFQSK